MSENEEESDSSIETRKEEDEAIKRHESLMERFTHLTSSEIIQLAVFIEQGLENIVAVHFCGSDRAQFLPFRSLLFREGRIDFADKIKMCKKLIKTEYPLIYEQISPIFNKLDKVRELRNKFAHSKILPPIYEEEDLYMESYKDGKILKERIDSEENKRTIEEASGCHFFLMKLVAELERHRSFSKKMPLPQYIIKFFRERWPTILAEEKESRLAEAGKADATA